MGSPFWQAAALGVAALFLLWETWRGWRAGVVRAGCQFGAIILSSILGYLTAGLAAMPFGGLSTVNGFLVGSLIGVAVGLAIFFLIWFFGALLFKRTDHQGSGMFRLLWGTGGAVFGFLIGICLLVAAVSVIKTLGTFAEAQRQTPPKAASAPSVRSPAVADGLITLKESIELGPAGKVVDAVDVVPPDLYELILQIGRLASDETMMARFLEYPGIQNLVENPKIAELVGDPEIVKAVESRNYLNLLRNKSLHAAVQDPQLAAELQKIDLRAALNFAAEKPSASPTPAAR